jgi:hypothetical protein
MVRVLYWGKLSKIPIEEKIDLVFDVLIPSSYLRAVNGNSKEELKKMSFYKREIGELLTNSNLEDYKKQELAHRLRYCGFLLGEEEW